MNNNNFADNPSNRNCRKRKYKTTPSNTKTKKKTHTKNSPTLKKSSSKNSRKKYCKGPGCNLLVTGRGQCCSESCRGKMNYQKKKKTAKKLGQCIVSGCTKTLDPVKEKNNKKCEDCRKKARDNYQHSKKKKSLGILTKEKSIRRVESAIGKRLSQIILKPKELDIKFGKCNARHENKFEEATNTDYDLDHIDALISSLSIDEMISKNTPKNLEYIKKEENRAKKDFLQDPRYEDYRYLVDNLKDYQRDILRRFFDVEILLETIEISALEKGYKNSSPFFIAALINNLTIEDTDELKCIIEHLKNMMARRQQKRRKRRT